MHHRLGPLGALLAVGCGGGVRPAPAPAPSPAPTPSPTPSAPPAAAAAPASRFAVRPGTAAYDVRSEATIDMTAGPPAERGRETVTTTARVDYELTAGRALGVAGTVSNVAVQGSARVTGTEPAPAAPVRFRGTLDARGPRLAPDPSALGCVTPAGAAQAAAVSLAREAAAWAPATIAVGTKWRDSVTTTTCRGPIGALLTTVARYEITAIDGARVTVRRETTLGLTGGGIAGGRTVTLTGTGTGVASLELDAARGRLARADGETRMTITVALPDGERTFDQQTRVRVSERPG